MYRWEVIAFLSPKLQQPSLHLTVQALTKLISSSSGISNWNMNTGKGQVCRLLHNWIVEFNLQSPSAGAVCPMERCTIRNVLNKVRKGCVRLRRTHLSLRFCVGGLVSWRWILRSHLPQTSFLRSTKTTIYCACLSWEEREVKATFPANLEVSAFYFLISWIGLANSAALTLTKVSRC